MWLSFTPRMSWFPVVFIGLSQCLNESMSDLVQAALGFLLSHSPRSSLEANGSCKFNPPKSTVNQSKNETHLQKSPENKVDSFSPLKKERRNCVQRRGPLAEAQVVIPEKALDAQSSGEPSKWNKRNLFKRLCQTCTSEMARKHFTYCKKHNCFCFFLQF